MTTRIEDVDFSVRVANCLLNGVCVRTLEELSDYSESDLLRQDNFGRKSLQEVRVVMENHGLSLSPYSKNFVVRITPEMMRAGCETYELFDEHGRYVNAERAVSMIYTAMVKRSRNR